MAINPMSAPIDYLGQMGLSPQDPAQALIGGLKIGTALREQRQMRELEQKNAQFQADMSAWRMNPTDDRIVELMNLYPEFGENIRAEWKFLDDKLKDAEYTEGMQTLFALRSQTPQVGIDMLDRRIQATEEAGEDATSLKLIRQGLGQGSAEEVAAALPNLQLQLAMLDPVRFEQFSKAQLASAQAGTEEATREAKQKKATAEATVAGINANFQEQLVKSLLDQRAASIEASGATAEEARANAEAQRAATEQAARGILPVGERPAAENTLRNEYLTQTKPYRDIKAAYDRVSAAEPTAVGDIALVFSYMKMLDPGSVVREGEFATASKAGGVPTRVINLYNKAVSGEILTDDQRASMRSQARELLKKTEQDEKQIRGGVERIAKSRGLNVDNIFYDFTAPTGGGEQPAASGDVVDTSNPLLQ
jgi:hypothetical protein